MRSKTSRRLSSAVWVSAAWLVACASGSPRDDQLSPAAAAEADARDGAEGLFAQHCAFCHGARGGGDGVASPLLSPSPRDFGQGMFRIVSTLNGVPTEADLVGVVRRGLPGSSMPGYAWMEDEQVRALAGYVRSLAVARIAGDVRVRYAAAGEDLTSEQAQEVARWRMTPGVPVEVPPSLELVDSDVLARGRQAFVERCAACHGTMGRGQTVDERWRDFPHQQWARDLTEGVLEGGASHEDLVNRIVAGMPGAAMPPQRFAEPSELQALVTYVQSLLPADSESRGVTRRQELRARRVDGDLPVVPDDRRWEAVPAVEIVMLPLFVRPESVTAARVAAVHDGTRLSVRLSWSDATRDDRAIDGTLADGCALQLSDLRDPPLFGMGTHERPHDIWHWSAFRFRDVAGGLDLVIGPDGEPVRVPFAGDPAPGELAPARGADVVRSEGMGQGAVDEGVAHAEPLWRDGRWSVVIVDELVRDGEGVALAPGRGARVSFAIWNGSSGDRGARKSISVWHDLQIAP